VRFASYSSRHDGRSRRSRELVLVGHKWARRFGVRSVSCIALSPNAHDLLQEFNHDQLRRALTAYLGHQLVPEVAARIEGFACTNPAPIPHTFGADISNDQNPEFYAFANKALSATYSPVTSRVIARIADGRIRAVVVFSDLRKWSIEMAVASDGSSRWLTRALLRSAFSYPFLQLGLPRVTSRIEADNARALALNEGLGYVREGVQRRQFGGVDAVLMGMLWNECRWTHA